MEHDLYFKIIYLCIKYESSTLMFSKDIKRKLFFNIEKGSLLPKQLMDFALNLGISVFLGIYKKTDAKHQYAGKLICHALLSSL